MNHDIDPIFTDFNLSEIPRWPAPGDKIKFKQAAFAFHRNCAENAAVLKKGQICTVRYCEPASCWCLIKIDEIPETEVYGADWLALNFFEYPIKEIKSNRI
jgi:hypothetical protein